jgi:ABC-type lipoprotein release transport system permease subunit
MWLTKLAWKNIWRNRTRSVITMAAIFFAVILSVLTSSLQDGIFDNLVRNVVSFYSGYIQLHKTGYWNEQLIDNSFSQSDTLYRKVQGCNNVESLTPRLESFALASSETFTKGCLVVGVDPAGENRITRLSEKISSGHYLQLGSREIVVAEGLASRMQLNLYDTIVLIAQGYHGSTAAGKYRVGGLAHFGSPDLNDRMVFMPLDLAQDFFGAEGQITSYVISLEDNNQLNPTAEELRKQVGAGFEIMTWEDMMPEIAQHIRTDKASSAIIEAILYLLICFGIFGTLLMMMVERKFELGMLVAVGMKKRKLSSLLMLESVFTVITGCLLGILFSMPIVIYLNRHPLRISGSIARVYERFGFEAVFPASTEPSHFINQGLVVLVIGLLLSFYPVIKIIRMNPVQAMRR